MGIKELHKKAMAGDRVAMSELADAYYKLGEKKNRNKSPIDVISTKYASLSRYWREASHKTTLPSEEDSVSYVTGNCYQLHPHTAYVKYSNIGDCYVATCVYGSYDCPQVWTLRRFRDNSLDHSWFGKRFIQAYYSVSPFIVKVFGSKRWFNRVCKSALNKFVTKLQNKGVDSSPYSDY